MEMLFCWVHSHLGVAGYVGLDGLVEQARLAHPNNLRPLPKMWRVEPQWEALGLEEMLPEDGEVVDSGSSDVVSWGSASPTSDNATLSSRQSTEPSDSRRDGLSSASLGSHSCE